METVAGVQPAEKHLRVLLDALEENNSMKSWEYVSVIGKGANSTVYKVVHHDETLSDRYCAMKVMTLTGFERSQLNNEIVVMNALSNEKHAVHIFDCDQVRSDTNPDISFLLLRMELLESVGKEKISESEAVKMGVQICDVLSFCHSHEPKIYHCDIKPENIFKDANGDYRLGDFGESRMTDKTLSSTGYRGTPIYMSPEMYNYLGYDGRSDVCSLGITLYTLLNGSSPFMDENTSERAALKKRLSGKPIPPIPGVSRRVNDALAKACAFEPKDRFADAKEFAEALAGEDEKKKPVFFKALVLILTFIAAFVLTVFAARFWGNNDASDEQTETSAVVSVTDDPVKRAERRTTATKTSASTTAASALTAISTATTVTTEPTVASTVKATTKKTTKKTTGKTTKKTTKKTEAVKHTYKLTLKVHIEVPENFKAKKKGTVCASMFAEYGKKLVSDGKNVNYDGLHEIYLNGNSKDETITRTVEANSGVSMTLYSELLEKNGNTFTSAGYTASKKVKFGNKNATYTATAGKKGSKTVPYIKLTAKIEIVS